MLCALLPAAFAGGTASPKPPPPPVVDFSGLSATADVQPKSPDGTNHPVHARLLVDKTEVAPGETFRIGLHLTQLPDWHTYWKSPGEVGLPTTITWEVPGVAKPYQYPVPQRFELEGMVSFGYDDSVLLFSEVTLPADASGTLNLAASAEWLVCKTSCIPGRATLTTPLVVGDAGKPTPWAGLFDHFQAQHPATELDGFTAKIELSKPAMEPFSPFEATLRITGPSKVVPDAKRYAFAPIQGDGWMINKSEMKHDGDALVVKLQAETLLDEAPDYDRIGGLFLLEHDGKAVAIEIHQELPWKKVAKVAKAVQPDVASASTSAVPMPIQPPDNGGLLKNLFMAFLGGLILNIMPCVLPVLTLKLYGLVEQVDVTPAEQRMAGLSYTAGIVASFLGLAIVALVLRSAVGNIGWGFQMQYPAYVAGLATVTFALGLSLFGVFELPAMGVNSASAAGSKEGPVGYFFTGVFATLLATPCSAPILGTATAFALSAPALSMIAIYMMIGVGLAFPFLMIAFVPVLYKVLPRPGPWMDTFKQVLGFSLVATAIWLVSVLGAQVGLDRLVGFLVFLAFVSGGCWIYGHFGGVAATFQRQFVAGMAGLLVAGLGNYLFVDLAFADDACDDGTVVAANALQFDHEIPWQAFSEDRVSKLKGTPVFIDFTAEWCVSCKFNEKTILETATVRDAMAKNGVVPLKADWTRQDPVISEWLARYGKSGVPFYLVLPASGDPIPLGEFITPGGVVAALEQAR